LRKLMDVSRIKSLGWQSSISLEDGLSKVYPWYLKNIAVTRSK
jgi:GDP-L-fucose synthase